jgi:hypothetical protein
VKRFITRRVASFSPFRQSQLNSTTASTYNTLHFQTWRCPTNRLPLPPELMSMIEKRDESDRRLEHRRASASKAAAAKAQEADAEPDDDAESDRRKNNDRRGNVNRRSSPGKGKPKR